MTLSALDIGIIVVFLLMVIGIGSAAAKRAGKSSSDFFLSGRTMPWWLLGVSMVACTFSCDTPNLVTDIVRNSGVAGNWMWWAFLLTGMTTVFIYAKLWRRAALDTDLGFYELRYSGGEAAFLRGFRALYLGIFFNVLIMASVSLAAIKIGQVLFGLTPGASLLIACAGVAVYATLGGLTGSIWADFFQYSIAMVGAIAAAVYAVTSPTFNIGGMAGLVQHEAVREHMNMLPFFANKTNALMTIFILPIAIQWWSVWYPGAEPGGGGYIAQRMLSAKNEKNAIGATLLFNFLHYAIRPWPWIVVALASLVVFPFDSVEQRAAAGQELSQPATAALVKQYEADKSKLSPEDVAKVRALTLQKDGLTSLSQAFPKVDHQFLRHDIAYPGMIAKMPRGLLGIIVASLIAAYMSTIATHLNWGSSYFVFDFYKRYLRPQADEKHLVLVGRLSMLGLLVLSGFVALWMTNAKASFDLMLQVGAGTGLIYILRWFWWRINAHSELSAMIISFAVACFFQWGAPKMGLEAKLQEAGWLDVMDYSGWKLVLGILVTTIGWLAVTLLTKPEKTSVLRSFYRKIQPGGPGWAKVVAEAAADGDPVETEKGWDVPLGIVCMMLGCAGIWGALFATGNFLYGNRAWASVLAAVSVAAVVVLMRLVGRIRVR